ncbi:MAG: stage III sporulation protein AE [Clostridiales bacterium]|nr:stage III sporulation protein AE [Clostridiales bacterium]
MNFWGKKGKWIAAAVFCLMGSLRGGETCYGAAPEQEIQSEQQEEERVRQEILEDLELKEVEEAVDELLEEEVSFTDMIGKMMQGGQALDSSAWKEVISTFLIEALGIQKKVCIHILLLVLLASIFSNLSRIFQNQQIGEISFYMIYLLLFVLLLKTFDGFSGQIQSSLEGLVEFMRALLPSYYLAMTVSTGISTAAMFYQMIIFIIYLAEKVILNILLPGIRVYMLIELINYLTKEEFLSKMTELLKSAILWVLKNMVGIILGIQLIQRLISPAVDALKRTALGKTAGAIPGLGNIFTGITEMVLGSAVLIKNCLGAAAVIIMLLAAIPPAVRLGVSCVFYQVIAALVQPVTDKRMVGCIHTMGESIGMLLKLLMTVEILFLLTVAILAGSLG